MTGAAPGGREILLAAALSAAGAALFTAPVLGAWEKWGIADWDQHQFFYGVARWSIVETGEPPYWNPYACGGNPFLAGPQSPALSPFLPAVLLLGVVPGIKVLIALHAALALLGAWLFGRRIGCGPVGAWVPAAAFGLSSAYALHLAAGHATWTAMAYVPFALAGLRAGFDGPARALAGGAAAALIPLAGNGQLFAFLLLAAGAWALLEAISRRSWAPAASALVMAASAAALAAVKLLPLAAYMTRVETLDVPDISSIDPGLLWHALLGRDQSLGAFEGVHAAQDWRWWEYGAYVGPAVPFLAAGWAGRRLRRAWPMAATAVLALVAALGAGWGVWDLLRGIPLLDALRVPSRAIVFAVLFLGGMAGLWVTEWERAAPRALLAAGALIVAADVGWVGRAALKEAFVVEPASHGRGAFRQTIGVKDFTRARDPASGRYVAAYSDLYPALLAGRGTINCYDRFHLPVRARPSELPGGTTNPAHRGEAFVDPEGSARIARLGGRTIRVAVDADAAGTLVVNQNHAPGWRTRDGRPVIERGGLLAAAVGPADREVVFVYTPPLLTAGAAVSGAAVLTLAAAAWISGRRR